MWIKFEDDRGKRIAMRLSLAMQRQRDKQLALARKGGRVVVVEVPRRTLTPRGAVIVLSWFIGMAIWIYACSIFLVWLFEERNGRSILQDALERLARQTSPPVSYTVVVIGLVLMVVCIDLPPILAAIKLFAPAALRKRLRRQLYMRRCPTCDYVLANAPSEPDGCTVCPECGGAWKVPDGAISAQVASEIANR
ncbi:MAG TPA: hypothetical protein VK157_00285 [Phycisphaerales bacterium]|nr:hypothetical protein [Phycisphaerales bacterium]